MVRGLKGILLPRTPFLGAAAGYQEARTVILGAPLDHTVSFRPGTRFGPAAIRQVSDVLEEYCPECQRELGEVGLCDLGDVLMPAGDVEVSLDNLYRVASAVLEDGKFPLFLGGEHLLTLMTARAVRERYPDLTVVHLDAHADLREEYQGQRLSHASVMRLVGQELGFDRIYQLGIRSGTREEFQFAGRKTQFFYNQVLGAVPHVLERVGRRPVYLSIDIDVVDPAFAGGVGTPEPGGISAGEILTALHALKPLRVVAADVVEVCPPHDPADLTSILAAKLVRECLLLWA